MTPNLGLQLRIVIAAMADVILPAVDVENSLAIEQCKLALGWLKMCEEQIDYSHAYELIEMQALIALIEKLASMPGVLASEVDARLASAKLVLNKKPIATSTLRETNHELRELVREILERPADISEQAKRQAHRAVLDQSAESLTRERAWFSGTGFDVYPESLKTIQESLGL